MQVHLVVVLEMDADLGAAGRGDLLGHQRPDQPGRDQVRAVEQRPQQRLADALGGRARAVAVGEAGRHRPVGVLGGGHGTAIRARTSG
jgi:hypothetical protein